MTTLERPLMEFDEEPRHALTGFHHPYAYVAGGKSDRRLAA
jgi:hypothetical protein